jgi:uncharacterized RDD family membrane protein YckC
MNSLRAIAAFWVTLSLPFQYLFSTSMVVYDSESGKGYATAGSHAALLAWTVCSVVLFAFLLRVEAKETPAGVPSWWRRFLASLIDFWFSVTIVASFGVAVQLCIESWRTGKFSWHFERNYSVRTDEVFFPMVLIGMALIFLYFVWPLTKGKQTLGCFILKLRVTPPFGTNGAFTFWAAIRRVWLEFWGMGFSLFKRGDRDGEGRTWYDRETNCTVILIKYE